jgi:hypothetical protein
MTKHTWSDTKGHHWFDKNARQEMPLIYIAYGDFTTPMKGAEHVQAHRNTKEVGRIGAIAKFTRNIIAEGNGFIMFEE